MTKPLSMDLRERAMARVAAGESVRVVAAALSIAPSSVVKWLHRLRATGSVAPGKTGGHVPPKIAGEYRTWLVARAGAAFTCAGTGCRAGRARAARGLPHDVEIRARAGSELQKRMARPSARGDFEVA